MAAKGRASRPDKSRDNAGGEVGWSAWQPYAPWSPTPRVLAETLDGGQSFRWSRDADGGWTGVWADCVAQLRLADGALQWRSPSELQLRVAAELPRYLGTAAEWTEREDALPWRSDVHLAQAMAAFRGLRILRQPFGETLLCFLCSATKQIVQIKQMVALLAERHGAESAGRAGPLGPPRTAQWTGPAFRRLPTWNELATVPEGELRACLLGFRARYIAETAQFLAARPGWLEETEALPYPAAKARLLELPGVGEKVADCVLLFGAGKLEAFPVDTWIIKTLARRYELDRWRPEQLAQFGRAHFGALAGFAQQFLFAWERAHGGR